MAGRPEDGFGINSGFEAELYQRFLHNRKEVDESWQRYFDSLSPSSRSPVPPSPGRVASPPPVEAGPDDEVVPLRGAAARIVDNMTASLAIPMATSQRIIPVKVIDENRRIINLHRDLQGGTKVSYTHLIAWGILKAIEAFAVLNSAYAEKDGEAARIQHKRINLGIAIDLPGRSGSRSLVVPNLKDAGSLNFQQFLTAYDELIARARVGHLAVEDFQGTTISLTNPGTVGHCGLRSAPDAGPGRHHRHRRHRLSRRVQRRVARSDAPSWASAR